VPVRPDPSVPARRVLADGAGTLLARFLPDEQDGRPTAHAFELETSLEQALPAILRDLRGWRIGADEALGTALLAAGARPVRHLHLLRRDLRAAPATRASAAPAGLDLRPADRPAEDLVDAFRAAFPPSHPDGPREHPRTELATILSGALGPLLDASALAVDGEGRVRAAVLVTASPVTGPWIMECFRDPGPSYAGAGRALLERALLHATRAGLATLGLTVTHGNPAQRLYDALGFANVRTVLSVDL
jgi:hypothetical protein